MIGGPSRSTVSDTVVPYAPLFRCGGGSADSLQALVAALPAPRVLWRMVPAGKITDGTVDTLAGLLASGDVIVDGGNSSYKDTLRRAAADRKSTRLNSSH